MATIHDLKAREQLDSRGIPTVQVDLILDDLSVHRATVPSGASTGRREALELRDHGKRYMGRGVQAAVNNINGEIKAALLGHSVFEQQALDNILIELDGSADKSRLGANAILAVSLAVLKAAAAAEGLELYQYCQRLVHPHAKATLPVPLVNIINGGAHADNSLDFQEFMIVPHNALSFAESLRITVEVFYALKSILSKQGYRTAVGDEGGFAPDLSGGNRRALDLVMQAINLAGFKAKNDISIALDLASSELYHDERYHFRADNAVLDKEQLVEYYQSLVNDYPICSLEDPCGEDDWAAWHMLSEELGNTTQLVGDDLFVTNPEIIQRGINENIANAVLLKMNQIGTISETLAAFELSRGANYNTIISHRSGETEDCSIAHLAVGLNAKQIKTGSVCRGERVAKYNTLLRIEEHLGRDAVFCSKDAFANGTKGIK